MKVKGREAAIVYLQQDRVLCNKCCGYVEIAKTAEPIVLVENKDKKNSEIWCAACILEHIGNNEVVL